ncbi:peptide-N4-asparagine amidase [Granulicella arctica]|uniref:Peptide N-acetyl-beta-D-glucosaminyl asparaginase amidase A N-terminal domain-containing protein n=1 Tax=Granulicella arctica TaxID=940613 RepID=A0A7Y9TI98_9BACT|nr:hypothetical protein [Granulicella arctica]
MLSSVRNTAIALFGAAALVAVVPAQVVIPNPPSPQIGSSNPVSAEPLVSRPSTTPCVVTLFSNLEFIDFNDKPITYTPPADCKGPWAKVVLTADFTVTAGRQYDRTAKFFLGGANIYFGTTAEPRSALSPSWHIERDVTDLSALFKDTQVGVASIANYYGVSGGVDYNGAIYSSATLEFYPASFRDPAPATPTAVYSFPTNETGRVSSSTDTVSGTFTLPRNTVRAYLDLVTQSQSSDEFWYTCVPNDVANELENCGNTGFRQTLVTIDGTPAGIAPVYPWIYTGGIDPYLWEPIPGVQTLNFKPYRVDLTPFAAQLNDGSSHTVAVSVYNADSGFDITGSLLLFADPFRPIVTGATTKNTLTATAAPTIAENLKTDTSGNITGTVNVTASSKYTIGGYVNTSFGRVDTTVEQTGTFANLQTYNITATQYQQLLTQTTTAHQVTTTRNGIFTDTKIRDVSYPLTLNYNQLGNADGTTAITTTVNQQNIDTLKQPFFGLPITLAASHETIQAADTLNYNAAGNFVSHTPTATTGQYRSFQLFEGCYDRTLTSVNSVLTAITDGKHCDDLK